MKNNQKDLSQAPLDSQLNELEQQALVNTITTKEAAEKKETPELAKEINGPKGLEPTRYGDWESKGRCYDF